MSPSHGLTLTREQQRLFLEWGPWRERMTRRLCRRFGRWLAAEKVDDLVMVETMKCAARYDEMRSVPFGAYALKRVVGAVCSDALRAQKRLEQAYKACLSCSELWLSDPKAVLGTDEERKSALHDLARQGATAMVLAGGFSMSAAMGGEDAMIDAVDQARATAAVQSLGPREREVVERRYGTGEQEIGTIADEMGLGAITVRRAHAEALTELRARFL